MHYVQTCLYKAVPEYICNHLNRGIITNALGRILQSIHILKDSEMFNVKMLNIQVSIILVYDCIPTFKLN